MFGIILWLVVITLIALVTCTESMLVGLIFGIVILCGFAIYDYISTRRILKQLDTNDETPTDREKAIDEWERQTGRTHPSRRHNNKINAK